MLLRLYSSGTAKAQRINSVQTDSVRPTLFNKTPLLNIPKQPSEAKEKRGTWLFDRETPPTGADGPDQAGGRGSPARAPSLL